MKIEALTGFCGVLSMSKGEIREYSDEAVLTDLISAGYVKEVHEESRMKKKKSAGKGEEKGEGK